MGGLTEILKSHNSICWYPSAGDDLQPLLILSEAFCKREKVGIGGEMLPDLFLLTDGTLRYRASYGEDPEAEESGYISNIGDLIDFGHTTTYFRKKSGKLEPVEIRVLGCEKMNPVNVPWNEKMFSNGKSEEDYGKVYYMELELSSDSLGEWRTELLYVVTENIGFAMKYLVRNRVKVDYIIRQKYGDEYGGANFSGDWLLVFRNELRTRYFISQDVQRDELAEIPPVLIKKMPSRRNELEKVQDCDLKIIHTISKSVWGNRNDVNIYEIRG